MKQCSRCKQWKDESEFSKKTVNKDGLDSSCRACIKERDKIYYEKNKEKILENKKKYHQEHKEDLKEKYHQNREKHIQYIRQYDKEHKEQKEKYYQEHKEQIKEYSNKYYQEHKEQIKIKQQKYREEHKEQIKEYYIRNKEKLSQQNKIYRLKNISHYKEYDRKRNKENKLSRNFSYAIWNSLKENKANKHWETLVPYNLNELKQHLESQFQEGMTWENMGKNGWHIDHIIPQDLFKPIKSSESINFKICWSLYNLRPLWGKDNLSRPRDEGSDVDEKQKLDIISKALEISLEEAKEILIFLENSYYERWKISRS